MILRLPALILVFAIISPTQVTTPPAFAVASVKRNTSTHNGIGNKFGPETLRWTNTPLEQLIEATYNLKRYQVVGGPAWLEQDRWDIDAKSDGPTTYAIKQEMLATLLADRFHLKVHRETREMPIYKLLVAKNGPKLTAALPQSETRHWGTTVHEGSLEMFGTDMRNLVFWLSSQLNIPIVDNTGLTGKYDFKLEWAQDDHAPSDTTLSARDLPLSAAIELALGLKIVAAKAPVDVLVIDHVERASEN